MRYDQAEDWIRSLDLQELVYVQVFVNREVFRRQEGWRPVRLRVDPVRQLDLPMPVEFEESDKTLGVSVTGSSS